MVAQENIEMEFSLFVPSEIQVTLMFWINITSLVAPDTSKTTSSSCTGAAFFLWTVCPPGKDVSQENNASFEPPMVSKAGITKSAMFSSDRSQPLMFSLLKCRINYLFIVLKSFVRLVITIVLITWT